MKEVMRKSGLIFCFWKLRSNGKNIRNTSAQGYYKAQRSMRKWWSSGIFFMLHPTTLGACRGDSRHLLNSMKNSIVWILCVIKGAKNMLHISTECMIWQPTDLSLMLFSTHWMLSLWPKSSFHFVCNMLWSWQDEKIWLSILTSSLPLAITSFSSTSVLLVVSDAQTVMTRVSTKKAHILNNKCGFFSALFPKLLPTTVTL